MKKVTTRIYSAVIFLPQSHRVTEFFMQYYSDDAECDALKASGDTETSAAKTLRLKIFAQTEWIYPEVPPKISNTNANWHFAL